MNNQPVPDNILALERPHPALWKYYVLTAICSGPAIIVTLPYLYFRFHTLRYKFDAEGVHMKVGILFRREVNLTYARIQDIHLRSNLVQRWLGLANLQVQTASGSSGPELVIEGFREFEALRDFLYTRMRGYHAPAAPAPVAPTSTAAPGTAGETVSLLNAIRDELRQIRETIGNRKL